MKRLWLFIFGIVIFSTKNQASPSTIFTSSDLPIIISNTGGQTIMDEPKVMVDMGAIYKGAGRTNSVTASYNDYNGKIAIEFRDLSVRSFDQVNISRLNPQNLTADPLKDDSTVKIYQTTGTGGVDMYRSYVSPNNSPYPYFQYHYFKTMISQFL